MTSRIGAVTLGLAVLLALAGCSGEEKADSRPDRPSTPASSATAWQPILGPDGRCGEQPAAVTRAGFEERVLEDPDVGEVRAVTAGRGRTVAVLLHQTSGGGLCGWLPFAARLVAKPGVQVVAIDLCGYGESRCHNDYTLTGQVDAVRVAIDTAVDELAAERVVVVGASMGGSVALMTAVLDDRVDSAVDLSGPVEWDGMDVVRRGRALRVPVLVSMADDEGEAAVQRAREIATRAPAGSRFVPAPSGHGYELLIDSDGRPGRLAVPVTRWVRSGS